MARIQPLDQATGKSAELLEVIKKKLGRAPNMLRTLAHSPAALELYLSMSSVAGGMLGGAKTRETIALLAARKNSCDYCAKAHTAIAKMAGLSDEEVELSFDAKSNDSRTQAILQLAASILDKKAHISDQDFQFAKSSGLTDAEILEVVAVTCINIFTNYVNHVADPDIDF